MGGLLSFQAPSETSKAKDVDVALHVGYHPNNVGAIQKRHP